MLGEFCPFFFFFFCNAHSLISSLTKDKSGKDELDDGGKNADEDGENVTTEVTVV